MMTFGLNQFKTSSYIYILYISSEIFFRFSIGFFIKVAKQSVWIFSIVIFPSIPFFYSVLERRILSWWKDFPGLESAANFSNLPSAAALTAMSFSLYCPPLCHFPHVQANVDKSPIRARSMDSCPNWMVLLLVLGTVFYMKLIWRVNICDLLWARRCVPAAEGDKW